MSQKTQSSRAAVLQANASFYSAFSRADFDAMSALWAERAPVACVHPGLPALVGREAVLQSWRDILREGQPFEMRCDHAHVQLLGDAALVLCCEGNGSLPAHLAATNAFTLEDGQWRMVHHHAGPLSRPIAMPVPSASAN